MSTRFVTVDRRTPLLLPPDLRDWVPGDDRVHFVLEAVEAISENSLRVNERGTGSAQYPPKMMLALLIYCYATPKPLLTLRALSSCWGLGSAAAPVLPGGRAVTWKAAAGDTAAAVRHR